MFTFIENKKILLGPKREILNISSSLIEQTLNIFSNEKYLAGGSKHTKSGQSGSEQGSASSEVTSPFATQFKNVSRILFRFYLHRT